MGDWVTAFTSFAGVVIGAVFLYLTQRYIAQKSSDVGRAQVEVEQQKVNQTTFETVMKQYETELKRVQKQVDQTTAWLVLALKHISDLRSDVVHGRSLTAFPEELKSVPFWLLSGNDDPPPTTDPRERNHDGTG